MNDTKFVYIVTTLRFGFRYLNPKRSSDGKYNSYPIRISPEQKKYFTIRSSRTWGWYSDLKGAEECVLNNYADIYEGEYEYALVEKAAEGILYGGEESEEHWYKWEGSWDKGGYKACDKPKEYGGVIHFMDQFKPREDL